MKAQWFIRVFLVGYHVLLFTLLPTYIILFGVPSISIVLWTVFLFAACNLSITTGYHRLYAHRSYNASKIVEVPLLFFSTLSLQGSAIAWSADHRTHHRHVDTDKDPYNIERGFWYAHMGWLFEDRVVDITNVKDLQQQKMLMIQHKYYILLATLANVVVTVGLGMILGEVFAAIVFIFLLRLFLTHHTTFFINSLAHTWGSRPYSREHSAVNNFVISLLTFGEGYHNYHHTFAGDYRNGVRWYQYDPTKLLIWTMSKCGLAQDLKRSNRYSATLRLINEDRKEMLNEMRLKGIARYKAIESDIQHKYKMLIEDLQGLHRQVQAYKDAAQLKKDEKRLLKAQIRSQRLRVKKSFKAWSLLCKHVFG